MTSLIEPGELARLRAYRVAACQVRDATIIARGQGTHITVWEDASGKLSVSADPLDREAFRSLATSLRLVYMEGEPGHFYSVCKIVRRHALQNIHARIAEIRGFYTEILAMEAAGFKLRTETGTRLVSPREVLETWMYGEMFHLNPEKQELLNILRQHPAEFQFNIQATVMLLCGKVLDLDDVVADLLEEPRVPRIAAEAED